MDVVRELRRGAVRLHALHDAADGELSGVWMSNELARHGYQISPGTLYPLLHDLEAEGLLTSSERTQNGRARRYYIATEAGQSTLAEASSALAELAAELLPTPQADRRTLKKSEGDSAMTDPSELDARRHPRQVKNRLDELIAHLHEDVGKVSGPARRGAV